MKMSCLSKRSRRYRLYGLLHQVDCLQSAFCYTLIQWRSSDPIFGPLLPCKEGYKVIRGNFPPLLCQSLGLGNLRDLDSTRVEIRRR